MNLSPLPLSASSPPTESISGVAQALHEGVQLARASTATLANEPGAYLSGLAQDIAEAGGRLTNCRTPFDVLAVQQSYAMARGKAWLDSAYRCFERCTTEQLSGQQGPGSLVATE